MNKYILLFLFVLLAGCASVGGVEITDDDTPFTVLTAFSIAVIVFLVKGYVEYFFAKRLERYKKKLDKE
jgi:uncharacterized membrane protein